MVTDVVASFYEKIKNKPGTLMSIDFGRKNVGVAISDLPRSLAMPLDILSNDKFLTRGLAKLTVDYGCVGIVVGWPLNLHGGVHDTADEVLFLCGNLYKLTSLPILLWDESMSTRLAISNVYSLDTGKRRDKLISKIGRGRDDHLAAQVILNQVLYMLYDRKA